MSIPPPPVLVSATSPQRPLAVLLVGIVLLLATPVWALLAALSIGTLLMPVSQLPAFVQQGFPAFWISTVEYSFGAIGFLISGIALLRTVSWGRRGALGVLIITMLLEVMRAVTLSILVAHRLDDVVRLFTSTVWIVLICAGMLLLLSLRGVKGVFDQLK